MSIGKNSINRTNIAKTSAAAKAKENKFYDATEPEKIENYDNVMLEFIPTAMIIPTYDEQSITCKNNFMEVVSSVRNFGIMIPILLRKVTMDGKDYYRILSGHKRFFAAKTLGLTKVPAEIITCSDAKATLIYNEIEKYDSKSVSYDKEDIVRNVAKSEDLPNYLL